MHRTLLSKAGFFSNLFESRIYRYVFPYTPTICHSVSRSFRLNIIGIQENQTEKLMDLFPDVAKELYSPKNASAKPNSIPYNYPGKLWWMCAKDSDHIYEMACSKRIEMYLLNKDCCPFCQEKDVNHPISSHSLLDTYPELVSEYFPASNHGLQPSQIDAECQELITWKCSKGHTYPMKIQEASSFMKYGVASCPLCRSLMQSTTLKSIFPSLTVELMNGLNFPCLQQPLPMTHSQTASQSSQGPSDSSSPVSLTDSVVNDPLSRIQEFVHSLTPDDKRVVWWICSHDDSHVWMESISNRVQHLACPFCQQQLGGAQKWIQ